MHDGRPLTKPERLLLIASVVTRKRVGHGRIAVAAQHIVVVQAELGAAPAIARVLDRTEHPQVVGTLAGDDTALVVVQDASDARPLAAELAAAIG